jgi:Mce-associated membrane protein
VSTPKPRRRIAGESKPGAPAPKTSVVKKAAKLRPTPKTQPKKASPPRPPAPEVPSTSVAPDVPSTASEPRTRRFSVPRMSTRLGALVALTLAAVVFGAVFGIRGFMEWRNDGGIVEAHEKAATTAASAGETIFTYQFNKLPKHLEDAKATMTPAFAKKFESIAPALQELAPQRKIQVKATVRNAAAIECGNKCRDDRATILVFIDQARVASDAKEPTVFGNRIKLMMVERDGRWLVNNIDAL